MNDQSKNDQTRPDIMIKLLILGDLSVGKTSFIYRFIYDKFNPGQIQTSELELKTGDIIVDKKTVRVQIWDTVGQEKYKSITKNLILRVQGIILMFDLSKKETYENIKTWINLINEECGNKMPILIVGNKMDLEDERFIKKEDAKAHFKNEKFKYVETSCKDGHNIKKAITSICKIIIHSKKIGTDISFSLNDSDISVNKKKHCC